MEKNKKIRAVSSDHTANILGSLIVITVVILSAILGLEAKAIKYQSWQGLGELLSNILNLDFISKFFITGLVLLAIFSFGYYLMDKGKVKDFAKAFIVIYLLATLVYILSSQATLKQYLEYAFWGLIIGLVISNVFGIPDFLRPALQSGFYVKVGLVLMGTEVIFSNIANFGLYGIAISWLVVPIVIAFMWWFGMKVIKMQSPTMVMVLAVTTSVCGVSAAVAAAASIDADKNDLTFSVGISMIFTIVMMVAMPLFIKAIGISELVGGAWIGNTVDSTGAVVLAGEALGPVASQIAAMIKMIQNVLIGFVSVAIAIFFAKREETVSGNTAKTSASEIWRRIPKFILGFFLMSFVFSFIIHPFFGSDITNNLISIIGTWKGWCFCLTFVCIGLETNFKELSVSFDEGKPITLYVVGQLFSLVLSLLVCWLVLGGAIIPAPEIQVGM